MRKNLFGDLIFTPEDQPYEVWNHLVSPPIDLIDVEDDPEFGWSGTLRGSDDNDEVQLQGFESRQDLVDWVVSLGLDPEEDIDDA